LFFIVENNGYAMGTLWKERQTTDIWKLGLGYEMVPVDGMNPRKVAEAMTEAIEKSKTWRRTNIPRNENRYRGHSMSDAQLYRSKDEVEEYKN
jgi:pyruvate dehydrogenase E1 component alpha subunit